MHSSFAHSANTHTHTPACSLVERGCKGCQKQRKRQPQINTFKWHGKKDGRKKKTRVLTTDLVMNSISVKARASEMSELCPMLNLFFYRYTKRWVLVLQNCLGWESWYQSLAFGVFLFPFYEEGSADFSIWSLLCSGWQSSRKFSFRTVFLLFLRPLAVLLGKPGTEPVDGNLAELSVSLGKEQPSAGV